MTSIEPQTGGGGWISGTSTTTGPGPQPITPPKYSPALALTALVEHLAGQGANVDAISREQMGSALVAVRDLLRGLGVNR